MFLTHPPAAQYSDLRASPRAHGDPTSDIDTQAQILAMQTKINALPAPPLRFRTPDRHRASCFNTFLNCVWCFFLTAATTCASFACANLVPDGNLWVSRHSIALLAGGGSAAAGATITCLAVACNPKATRGAVSGDSLGPKSCILSVTALILPLIAALATPFILLAVDGTFNHGQWLQALKPQAPILAGVAVGCLISAGAGYCCLSSDNAEKEDLGYTHLTQRP